MRGEIYPLLGNPWQLLAPQLFEPRGVPHVVRECFSMLGATLSTPHLDQDNVYIVRAGLVSLVKVAITFPEYFEELSTHFIVISHNRLWTSEGLHLNKHNV